MPLDDTLLDAIAGTIAETETEFRGKVEELTARLSAEHDRLSAALDEMRWGQGESLVKLHGDITESVEAVAKVCGEASAALEKQFRESMDAIKESIEGTDDALKFHDDALFQLRETIVALRADLDAAEQRLKDHALEQLREERLEAQEQLLSARRRYDWLSADLEEKIAAVKDGEPGPAGKDGEAGEPGKDGEPGPAGRDGIDGRDGITGEPRGKYEAEETYLKFDRVSFNGSEWIARQDDPGPLPGDGWMLGAQGKRGRPGVGIQGISVKDYALVLEMSDGKTITVDLTGMFERYDRERSE